MNAVIKAPIQICFLFKDRLCRDIKYNFEKCYISAWANLLDGTCHSPLLE
jgi:hypothetical protein